MDTDEMAVMQSISELVARYGTAVRAFNAIVNGPAPTSDDEITDAWEHIHIMYDVDDPAERDALFMIMTTPR